MLIASLSRVIDDRIGPRDSPSNMAEKLELDRIDRLEPPPLPGLSPGPDTFPDKTGDPRLYTAAYERGARVLRIALEADHRDDDKILEPDLELLAKTLPSWRFSRASSTRRGDLAPKKCSTSSASLSRIRRTPPRE